MDHSQYAEDGCFVYQVIGEPIEVRYKPSDCDVSRTGQLYSPGDMVAMDRVLCSYDMTSYSGGPYLRLADGTGWLFERKEMEQTMQRVAVHCGLWSFYVGNYPEGQALLRHPTDRADMSIFDRSKKKQAAYESLQKIYCDRKVQSPQTGINFYRVQGTNGWVVDRRVGLSRKDDYHMLIEEHCVETGRFAFQALIDVGIRGLPRLGNESHTGRGLRRGDICIADAIYRPPFINADDGPLIHLVDGSGWLAETENAIRLLQPIPIHNGVWSVSVLNPPHGLPLYRHPVSHQIQEPPEQCCDDRQDRVTTSGRDSDYWVTLTDNEVRISLPHRSAASRINDMRCHNIHYETGTNLECDRMIKNGGASYYRVTGTEGWIAGRKSTGEKLVQIIEKEQSTSSKSSASIKCGGWTIEFVRGAAAVVHGMKELVHNEGQEAITFKTAMGVRLHVYYASRTVGVAMDDPEHGKMQLFCRDCTNEELGQILFNPPLNVGSQCRYGRRRNNDQLVEHTPATEGYDMCSEEEGYRNELLDVEREMNRVREKEQELLHKLMEFDTKRSAEALCRRGERMRRSDELERAQKETSLLVHEKVKEIAHRQEIERRQKETDAELREHQRRITLELTCLECYKAFHSTKACDEHCKTQHGLFCGHCRSIFRSSHALDEHCIRRGHY